MENIVNFYPTAKWVALEGSFTAEELKGIIKELEEKQGK